MAAAPQGALFEYFLLSYVNAMFLAYYSVLVLAICISKCVYVWGGTPHTLITCVPCSSWQKQGQSIVPSQL